jgi:nicotinate dehydrogenase subunit B
VTGLLQIFRKSQPPTGLAARAGDFVPREEVLVQIDADGQVLGFCGHVDLGTGIATSLAQIVADELDADLKQVRMVLGHTDRTPDQGATIASETIQITAKPLRKAAAQARRVLLDRAATLTNHPANELSFRNGKLEDASGQDRSISMGDLVCDITVRLELDEETSVKTPSEYRVVGREMPRVDIPDKVTGRMVYVHDVRVPAMLHARVVRPPYAGYDHGPFVGRSLLDVDRESVAHITGLVDVVVIGDFVGVVTEREEQAVEAAYALKVTWAPPALPDLSDPIEAVKKNPYEPRVVLDQGDAEGHLATLAHRLDREYHWPYQMHGSIGPSCSVADWSDEGLTVWSGTQNPHMLQADIAMLMGLPKEQVTIVRHEAAGCYGRNCADDVGGDAALLSRAVGRPVRVQLSREQEHVWEPKGTAQLISIRGGLDEAGNPVAYDLDTSYPSNVSPLLALVLTGVVPGDIPVVTQMGDRTAIPPYDYTNARITVKDMPPMARASWFRGVSALPNSFAHDSYIDELAAEAGVDPLEYRLRYLPDQRAADLLKATAARAGWEPRTEAPQPDPQERILQGRGLAYALYVHGPFPGKPAAWSAWVADVEVDRLTGVVSVTRAVVGQDAGLMINPAGVRHQLHGNVVQSTSRILTEQVTFDDKGVESREWGGYPIIQFPDVPEIEPVLMERPDQPPLGAGESASVPSAAAIANAIYAATGVRFRDVPFTPEKVKARLDEALGPLEQQSPTPLLPLAVSGEPAQPALRQGWKGLLRTAGFGAVFAVAGSALTGLLPWRAPIAPVAPPASGMFSPEIIARGKLVAAAGDCAVCHTAPGSHENAGGFALETPFGIIYSTNLTPDPATGIGRWSYQAFERAMREGIGRDGRHLYPAFPYTAFAKTSDEDMQALYAYLMSQEPVRKQSPKTTLKFPYNLRFSMAGWNALFHSTAPFVENPAQSAQWNRGAYLAEGLGHCSACHTPRNALGAERTKTAYLAGGEAEGWVAPALSALSRSPIPWSEDDLYAYLRTGFSPNHGPAGGPMAPVVHAMEVLPDEDVRAIAHYIASFDTRQTSVGVTARREEVLTRTASLQALEKGEGARIYNSACAVCHEGEGAHLYGARPQLALNSNVWADTPDNLIRVLLDGAPSPAHQAENMMPAYRHLLSDRQMAEVLAFLRRTMAPEKGEWSDLATRVARIRAEGGH